MEILISGSIAYDYLMRFPGRFKDSLLAAGLDKVSLSFLVDDMTKHWGGVAANICYSLALLGIKPHLVGTVGRDFGDYRQHLEDVGVQTTSVRQHDSVFTASFFGNTDLENNQIASFYAGAMGLAHLYSLADVYDGIPDLVVISPNDPKAMIQQSQECRMRGIRFMADPSQQVPRLNGEELLQCIHGAAYLVVNEYEAEVILNKTALSFEALREIVETVIITRGGDGSTIYLAGQADPIQVDIFKTDYIVNPTGVGDGFRAGLLRGILAGFSLELSAQMGALCATYALEHVGTQNHHFSVEEFINRFRTRFDDHNQLDQLL